MDYERVQAEVEAKVAAEQQNEDVVLRKIRAQVENNGPQTSDVVADISYSCGMYSKVKYHSREKRAVSGIV